MQLNIPFNKSSQDKFFMRGKHFKQSDFFMKVTQSLSRQGHMHKLLHSKSDHVLAGCHREPRTYGHALTLVEMSGAMKRALPSAQNLFLLWAAKG